LQEGGASVTEKNKEGYTALHFAASKNHPHMLTSLISDFGAAEPDQLKSIVAAKGDCALLCKNTGWHKMCVLSIIWPSISS
jgi:S-formylglutathione hydrolase FrmB